ncbi:L-lactate permease [Candidatus Gracilibacteria bacterium]|nr:L-lactate permease [Candidatus Gracilibacteria bacterium]
MNVFFSAFPIVLLVWLMVRRRGMPSFQALPLAVAVLYIIRIFVFQADTILLHAGVISGLLMAWTPILVIWGAVLLFQMLEISGALKTIHEWLETLAEHRVEQVMLIAWAFSFFIEGVSGFGTPVALAAPLLVQFGFSPLRVVMLCLVMNSVPVSFGAVGTPTWFGLGALGLPSEEILRIGQNTALIHFFAGLIIPFLALRFLLSWEEIRKNWRFILLSILSCTIPFLALSLWSTEFPALIGGAVGIVLTIFLARRNIGLARDSVQPSTRVIDYKKLFRAFAPLVLVIVLLVATRLEWIGLKSFFTSSASSWSVALGQVGTFSISPSLVLGLKNILGTGESWSHATLYVPSFVPFLAVTLFSFLIFSFSWKERKKVFSKTWKRMKRPILALSAALVFVKLLMVGDVSPAVVLGETLASISGKTWIFFSPLLGALGAFFSGSNTVSNLTFGAIQQTTAVSLSLPETVVLALQNVGGAFGNMVSIQNIIAGSAVVGLINKTGTILRHTIWPLLAYAVIAGVCGIFL